MNDLLCDLHTHSIASDGSDPPGDVAQKAAEAGLAAFALTDHDTVAGLAEAAEAAAGAGVEFLPGIEFSVRSPTGNMHILGYMMDVEEPRFLKVLHRVQQARMERTPKLIARLASLGMEITEDELYEISRGGQVGRPHFARVMVDKGYVRNVSQAFSRFLARGAAAYVPKSILRPEEAVAAIRNAGGIAVLAHPFSLMCSSVRALKRIVAVLCEAGLDGVECYYSEHSVGFTRQCLKICDELSLIATGGSDYHGKAKPYISLGRGRGGLAVPCSCVEGLRARLRNGRR